MSSILSADKIRLVIRLSASAVSLYAAYNIYTIIKKQKQIDELEKSVEKVEKVENSNEGCGAGDACCQSNSKPGQGDCGTGQKEHVFGEQPADDYEYSSDDDENDDKVSIAGSRDGPLLDIEDLGTAAVDQMENNNSSDDNGSQDSGVMIHKKNEDLIEKFKNHKEMVDDTGETLKIYCDYQIEKQV